MYDDIIVAIYKSAHKGDFDNAQIGFRALDLTLQTVGGIVASSLPSR